MGPAIIAGAFGGAAGKETPDRVVGQRSPLAREGVSSPSLRVYKLKPVDHLAGRLESPGDSKFCMLPPSSEFL